MGYALKITRKGQITLKRAVLHHIGAHPGERIAVDLLPDGRVILQAARQRPPLGRLRGSLGRSGGKPASIEEMQEAIEAGAAEHGEDAG